MKESNPLEVSEYAVANELVTEPAFQWWIPTTLRRRDRIISKLHTRFMKRMQKFGIDLPKTIQKAYQLDKKNGNKKWAIAITKEMNDDRIAFDILDTEDNTPIGYQKIHCHLVFDVKVDFTHKARLVAGWHTTDVTEISNYSNVVSRESVRTSMVIASLNDFKLEAGDIQNAYLTAPCLEKIYTICGPEFDQDLQGRRAVIVRALYGLRSSGKAF